MSMRFSFGKYSISLELIMTIKNQAHILKVRLKGSHHTNIQVQAHRSTSHNKLRRGGHLNSIHREYYVARPHTLRCSTAGDDVDYLTPTSLHPNQAHPTHETKQTTSESQTLYQTPQGCPRACCSSCAQAAAVRHRCVGHTRCKY
jgi:hypothetical protein